MNRRDFASGLFWVGISVYVLTKALDLGVGQFSTPGSGFVLFWSSLVCGVLAAVLTLQAALRRGRGNYLSEAFKGLKWSHALMTVAALLIYGSLLTPLGFMLSTFGLMVFLFILGKVSPWITISGALLTVFLSYGIFHFALQIQFPLGILGW